MKMNSTLRQEAYQSLEGNWTRYVVVTFVYLVILAVLSFWGPSSPDGVGENLLSLVISVVYVLVALPIDWSLEVMFLRKSKDDAKGVVVGSLFDGFKDFKRVLGTMLLVAIYTILWTLLLIVPGIIKQISYTLTPFILKDRPDLSYDQAIEESMRLMEGHKMDFFLLALSMIGWVILCFLTLGIGFLWLTPYWQMIKAKFYEDRIAEDLIQD